MFPRVNTVKQGGKTYHYLQILQSFRHQGRVQQRLVANLGRVDLLGDKLDRLVASLSKYCKNTLVAPDQIECKEALAWGQVLLARYLWQQVNLSEIVRRHCRSTRQKFDVAQTACASRAVSTVWLDGWNIPLSVILRAGVGSQTGWLPSVLANSSG